MGLHEYFAEENIHKSKHNQQIIGKKSLWTQGNQKEKTCFLKIILFQISELNHRVLNLFEIQEKLMIDFFDQI